MKNAIKKTRELMNGANKFLYEIELEIENFNAEKAAEEFENEFDAELVNILGPRWQAQGGKWSLDDAKIKHIQLLIYKFIEKNYPENITSKEEEAKMAEATCNNLS